MNASCRHVSVFLLAVLASFVGHLSISFSPGNIAAAQDEQPAGDLTQESVRVMLTNMGYAPEVDGSYIYVTLRDQGRVHRDVALILSADKESVWISLATNTSGIDAYAPEPLARLLALNAEIKPAAFSFNPRSEQIVLSLLVPGPKITPVQMRRALETFGSLCTRAEPLWTLSDWPLSDGPLGQIKRLRGSFRVAADRPSRPVQSVYLSFLGEEINDDALKHLEGMNELLDLQLNNTKFTDKAVQHLAKLKTLRMLGLQYTNITDDGVAQLTEALPALETITLGGQHITDKSLRALRVAKNLRGVLVASAKITDAGIAELKGITHLNELSVFNCPEVTDASLDTITQCPDLTVLFLADTSVTDAAAPKIATLTNLKELGLGGSAITSGGLRHFTKLNLTLLSLYGSSGIDDGGLIHVKSIPTITDLDLTGTKVTNDGLAQLAALPELESLRLDDTAITDAGLPDLKKLSGTLRLLGLSGTKVSPQGIEDLRRALPNVRIETKSE